MNNSALNPLVTSSFINQVTDMRSDAKKDVSFWTPVNQVGYYYTGLYATPNYYAPPAGFQLCYAPNGGDDNGPYLAPPVGFEQVWACEGNGTNCWLGIYAPVAPPGYVALGCVASPNFYLDPPQVAQFPALMCVREDLCTQITLTAENNLIYTDQGSGCPGDVSVFLLPNSRTAYAVSGYPDSVVAYDIIVPQL